jgi:multiple sugar transport system substrate-binding protein
MGAFIDDHQSYSWQEALPFFADGEATAYLMGNFAVAAMRDSGLTDDQIDFYQFPLIDASQPQGEDAPTDTFHVPSGAQNVEAARAFLAFVASPDVQTRINNGDNLGQLPVNANSSVDADEFLEQGLTCWPTTPRAVWRSSSTATSRLKWQNRHGRSSGVHGVPRQSGRHP